MAPDIATPTPTPRARVRRGPGKGRYDRETIERILDESRLAHVAFAEGDLVYGVPMLHARVGDRVYIHGSVGSRLVRVLASGVPACLTVTRLTGLVLARSAFEHSANYESVMVLGRFTPVRGAAATLIALRAFSEAVLPGRWSEVRPPNDRELRATVALAIRLSEASAKIREGPPDDDDTPDALLPVWAGVLPIETSYGNPMVSPGMRQRIPVPRSVQAACVRRDPQG